MRVFPERKCKYEGCDFQTNDYGKYMPHLFIEHGEGEKLQCLHCQQEFINERVYDYHITNKHEPKLFQCSECNRWYKTKFNLQEHWEKYHGSKPEFMCHICGKVSADQKVLDAHIKTHSQAEVSKAEILEEIGNAQKRAKERKATKSSAATSSESRPGFSSPTPSEIDTAVPAVAENAEEEGEDQFTVVQVHQEEGEEGEEKDD